ncbi:PHP domain-containing protein [Microbulbifer sp. HZ11]|uniref:PHP domain-containing protein n=1 Tax=unclassified Microbulbifer TaxID=2619833 RepID=UPI00068BE461|nr:PHP domain-containing protein [Microbulbifer sp. HZ11]
MDTARVTVTSDTLSGQVDLHCHSTASDGILSPAALVSRAKSAGVTLLALTDHDTVAGIDEAAATAREQGVTLMPGIELTARWGRRVIHVVGLNIDRGSDALTDAISERARLRRQRAREIAARLEKRGFTGAFDGARSFSGGDEIGRPHFARWMVAQGYVSDTAKAFKRYLGQGKIGDVSVPWPALAETVAAIHAAKGAAVLAHPLKYGLTRTRLLALLKDFQSAGGDAAEVVCGQQNPVQTREIQALMADAGVQAGLHRPNLLASVGSDFHQPEQPWRALGSVHLPVGAEPVWALWQS